MADFVRELLVEVDEGAETLDELLRSFRHARPNKASLLPPPFDISPSTPSSPILLHITSLEAFAGKTQLLYHLTAHLAAHHINGYILYFTCKRPFNPTRVAQLAQSDDGNEALKRILVFIPDSLQNLIDSLTQIHHQIPEMSEYISATARITAVILDDAFTYADSSSKLYQELSQILKLMSLKFECPVIYTSRTKQKGNRRFKGEILVELEETFRAQAYISLEEALIENNNDREREFSITIDGKPTGLMRVASNGIILE